MLRRMLNSLVLTGLGTPTLPSSQLAPLVTDQKSKSKSYKPMMSRQTSGSSSVLHVSFLLCLMLVLLFMKPHLMS